jgi:hypothetical protein
VCVGEVYTRIFGWWWTPSIVDSLLATGVRIQQRHLNGFGRNSLFFFFFFLSELCSALFLVGNNPTVRFAPSDSQSGTEIYLFFNQHVCLCRVGVIATPMYVCAKWRKWTTFCCLCVCRRNWPITCYIFTTSHVLLLCLSSQVTPQHQTKEEREKWAEILTHTERERERENIFVFVISY